MSLPPGVPTLIVEVAFPAALGLSLVLVAARFALARTIFDRLAAVESFSLAFLSTVAVLGLVFGTEWFMDFILVYSLVGYVATVAVAKYLLGGTVADD